MVKCKLKTYVFKPHFSGGKRISVRACNKQSAVRKIDKKARSPEKLSKKSFYGLTYVNSYTSLK